MYLFCILISLRQNNLYNSVQTKQNTKQYFPLVQADMW